MREMKNEKFIQKKAMPKIDMASLSCCWFNLLLHKRSAYFVVVCSYNHRIHTGTKR